MFTEVFENVNLKCAICGEIITNDNYIKVDGQLVCDSCQNEHVHYCDCCGRAVLDDDCHIINYELLCTHCFEENYEPCDCCGEMSYKWDMYWTADGNHVCDYCSTEHYRQCDSCSELIPESEIVWGDDNECYYCESCYNRVRNRAIKNYYYKPVPLFYGFVPYGESPLYMGVELEMDRGGEDGENAQELLDIMNDSYEHIYIKHDGSIHDGFEVVSHPATLDYHINCMEWNELMRKALRMGYRSHDTDTCGLHVHVSRDALGNTYAEQDETISKILYFIENNWDYIVRFTRRTENNLDHWASRYGIEESVASTYKKAKGDYYRYRCLNLCNDHTIEFRIFRGTLKHSTFCATLQFVHYLCKICKVATADSIEKFTWCDFVTTLNSYAKECPELIEYLNIRGLNV